jgi:hypothetical protein
LLDGMADDCGRDVLSGGQSDEAMTLPTVVVLFLTVDVAFLEIGTR